jgi:hypothetical protein
MIGDYRKWEEQMADERKACLACEQHEYLSRPTTDLSACMPGVYEHKGPYCTEGSRSA